MLVEGGPWQAANLGHRHTRNTLNHTRTHIVFILQVVRDSFGAFAKLKLEEGQGSLEGPLIRLDMLTRDGLPLAAALVS